MHTSGLLGAFGEQKGIAHEDHKERIKNELVYRRT